ncbi:MAG: hypothetical protein V1727_00885 [Candidatus Omnitrophota bacterium]
MAWFIGLIGLAWIVAGIFGLTATKKTVLALSNFIKNTKRQSLGLISLILGVLFLISASATTAAWFVIVVGVMGCLKGLAVMFMPQKQLKETIDWWFSAPDTIYKAWAIGMLIFGIALFYII